MSEAQENVPSKREALYREALWKGFVNQETCVAALRAGKVPWFSELAPLSPEERVFVIGQLCKQWFPDMTGDAEKQAFLTLGKMYGVKLRKRWRRNGYRVS